jgi:AcrR family transcriptional regulator
MARPAYTRLDVDERRRLLLERGEELFTRHSYDELSMARIAREAGISKALLYHYFPSKQAYFTATLEQAAADLAARVAPDPALAPREQLATSLDAYLDWIDEHRDAYVVLLRSVGLIPDLREMVTSVRAATATTILAGLHPDDQPPPALRAAIKGWLLFLDGVLNDWIEHGDIERTSVRDLILNALVGAVEAAGDAEAAGRLRS